MALPFSARIDGGASRAYPLDLSGTSQDHPIAFSGGGEGRGFMFRPALFGEKAFKVYAPDILRDDFTAGTVGDIPGPASSQDSRAYFQTGTALDAAHRIVVSGDGTKVLTNILAAGSGAGYTQNNVAFSANVNFIYAYVRFLPGATANSSVALVNPLNSISGGLGEMGPHAVFTSSGYWECGYWKNPGPTYTTTTVAGGALTGTTNPNTGVALTAVGQSTTLGYWVGWSMDRTTGTVTLRQPGGEQFSVVDANFNTLGGPWAFCENFATDYATDGRTEILGWIVG